MRFSNVIAGVDASSGATQLFVCPHCYSHITCEQDLRQISNFSDLSAWFLRCWVMQVEAWCVDHNLSGLIGCCDATEARQGHFLIAEFSAGKLNVLYIKMDTATNNMYRRV